MVTVENKKHNDLDRTYPTCDMLAPRFCVILLGSLPETTRNSKDLFMVLQFYKQEITFKWFYSNFNASYINISTTTTFVFYGSLSFKS